ncbi:hypothetical protein Goshw_007766 [Gossypium schwendimanii]|uniref:Uncharacterized protein n=1 Tax=Gossypium schwendimanii TaxID=34291 RepID=A0A7J9N322_GOSSC|nr:hypothetical protein [Gossypium schwendimanii]
MKTVKLGPMRINSSKATKLVESSARLSPIEEMSLESISEKEVTMQTLKLGSMRFISVDTLEGLTPLRKVGCTSSFEKVVMQVGQLTRVNATRKVHSQYSDSVLRSNLLTWQECRGPFEVLEQREKRDFLPSRCINK